MQTWFRNRADFIDHLFMVLYRPNIQHTLNSNTWPRDKFYGITPIDQLPAETQKARYATLKSFRTNHTRKFSAQASEVLLDCPAVSSDTFIITQQHNYTRLHHRYQQILYYHPFRKVTNSSLPHVKIRTRKVKLKQRGNESDKTYSLSVTVIIIAL
jgi:hypothetical protein